MPAALSFMIRRHRTALVAGGLLAAAGLMLATEPRNATGGHVAAEASVPAGVTVEIAAHSLPAGAIISPADIATRTVIAPPSTALMSSEAAVGRMVQKPIAGGGVLLSGDLRDMAAVGIAAKLSAGQLAFSIRVAEDDIVGGFLQSGDRVDIFATLPGTIFPAKGADSVPDRSKVLLLLQDISVLAVGENLATGGTVQPGARTVSLSLMPTQLAQLTLALRLGKVSLAIRKPGDDAISHASGAVLADLLSSANDGARPASRPTAIHSIPFYAGTHVGALDLRSRQ
jgi:pilus assembly protein CpaB